MIIDLDAEEEPGRSYAQHYNIYPTSGCILQVYD